MFPGNTNYQMESFRDATTKPYGYLLADCHQLTPESVRLRTSIFPGERQTAYVKRTYAGVNARNVHFEDVGTYEKKSSVPSSSG